MQVILKLLVDNGRLAEKNNKLEKIILTPPDPNVWERDLQVDG